MNQILQGDALEVLRGLDAESIDAMVTDPPAGISFMGKTWDGDKGGRDQWIAWLSSVMVEALRVLKPGAHALVWAIPRTSFWTSMALDNAGFEIRDVLHHIFGSGYPKSLSVAKAISPNGRHVSLPELGMEIFEHDHEGTALKPATEHWILARKPLSGTVAANVLEHGTGGINVDSCRVGTDKRHNASCSTDGGPAQVLTVGDEINGREATGRWPPNLLLTHAARCDDAGCVACCPVRILGEQSGTGQSGFMAAGTKRATLTGYSGPMPHETTADTIADSGTAARFFPTFRYESKPSVAEREKGLYSIELIDVEWRTCKSDQDQKATLRVDMERSPPRVIGVSGTKARNVSAWNTFLFGSGIEDACRVDSSCTIETMTSSTTESEILSWLTILLTSACTRVVSCGEESGGNHADDAASCNQRPSITVESQAESPLGVKPVASATRLKISASVRVAKKTAGELTDRADGSDGLKSPRAGAGRTSSGRLNTHCTVKPIALMQWLCRLITPPGGTVLDPFCGSGTTGIAALREGFSFVGVELDPEYAEIARSRIVGDAPLFNQIGG